MRSSFFLGLSILVHGLIIAAVALTPQANIEPQNEVEMSVSESEVESAIQESAPAAQPVAEPVKAAPQPKAPVQAAVPVKAQPKKQVAKKAPKMIPVAAKMQEQEAPAETAAAAPVEEPEQMDPETEDQPDVTLIPVPPKEDPPAMVPVKETPPAGVQADTSETTEDDKGLAGAAAAAPVAAAAATSPAGEGTSETLNKGGATEGSAVSYLDLKQAKGNKIPEYPLAARKENRQGQVELLYRVTKDGRVADVQVAKSSGFKDLDQAAVSSISKYKYVPGQEGWARHPIAFTLKGEKTTLPGKLRSAGTN